MKYVASTQADIQDVEFLDINDVNLTNYSPKITKDSIPLELR